ncbi:CHAT domain-containing protein [Myxococcota bacterium]|nr:CHAT domain-containing protein [Myxococcota bacterium]
MPPVLWLGLSITLAVGSGACRRREAPAAPRPLDALLAGCRAGTTEARCLVTRGSTLSVWLPISPHDIVTTSGPVKALAPAVRDTGVLHRFVVASPGGPLRIEARTGTITRSLELTLTSSLTGTASTTERAQSARRNAAFAALREGAPREALEHLTHAEEGDPYHARRATMLAAYVASVMLGDHVEAERRLARTVPPEWHDGEGTALVEYHRGLVRSMTGDRRAALETLEVAARYATRLDLSLLGQIRELEALQLVEIGRADEAVTILAALAAGADALEPWPRADLLNNLASARITAGGDLTRARSELERALADYSASEAITDANNARVSLAFLEVESGRPEAARRQLDAVHGPELPITAAWRRIIDARLKLTSGDTTRACAEYRRLAEDARRVLWSSIEARAEAGLGECLEARGEPRRALDAFTRARSALDGAAAAIPIDRGALERLDGRVFVEEKIVELWLELGDVARAFEEARTSRLQSLTRVLRARARDSMSPDARARWLEGLAAYRVARAALDRAALDRWQSTAADGPRVEAELERLRADVRTRLRELLGTLDAPAPRPPQIPPGELRLLSSGTGARAVIFAGTRERVHAVREATELAPLLTAARSIRVVATPSPDLARALHGRAWAHTTDLPGQTHTISVRRALVVADPRGDLPHARREGEEVAEQLRTRGWEVSVLFGSAARRDALERALSQTTLFHYAGHGRDRPERRWDAALLLAEGELDVADLVATSTVPPFVVLSGCETAAIEHGDLTLAQAFAIAGAEAIVATSTVVDDAVARALARALYEAPAEAWSLVESFENIRGREGVFRLLVR